MKTILAILLLLPSLAWGEDNLNFKFDGRCPHCRALGMKSTVTIGTCWSTLLWCGNGHYDEDGKYHPPKDCNSTSCSYSCSNGHEFAAGLVEGK